MHWTYTELPGIRFPATPPHRLINSDNLSFHFHILNRHNFFLNVHVNSTGHKKTQFFFVYLRLRFTQVESATRIRFFRPSLTIFTFHTIFYPYLLLLRSNYVNIEFKDWRTMPPICPGFHLFRSYNVHTKSMLHSHLKHTKNLKK